MPQLNVRLDDDEHELLMKLAGLHRRSMASEIRYLIAKEAETYKVDQDQPQEAQ